MTQPRAGADRPLSALERGALARWRYRGQERPPWAVPPQPGQESVWDYPRPPRLLRDAREVTVGVADITVARSRRALRVLETASPPTFYLPPDDVDRALLERAAGSSFCEWKGEAVYWSIRAGRTVLEAAAWSYEEPTPRFEAIRGWLSFYPARLECSVAGVRVQPQAGGFYGGWVTPEIVGPWKGAPGSSGW